MCAKCEKPFLGHRHYEKKGLAYCETHYHQLFGNLCFVCNQVIGGDGMCFTWTFVCTGVLELKTLLESFIRKAGYITILYVSVLKHSHYYCHCWHHYCLCCYCYHQLLCTLPLRSIFTHIKNCSFTLTTSFHSLLPLLPLHSFFHLSHGFVAVYYEGMLFTCIDIFFIVGGCVLHIHSCVCFVVL